MLFNKLLAPLLRVTAITCAYPTLKIFSGQANVALSLLIVTRNRSSYLDLTLSMLYNLWFPSHQWELLVIDNCSQDNTPDVLDRYEQGGRLPLIRYRLSVRHEHTELLNLAIEMAQGDIITFIQDCCLVAPHFLLQHIFHQHKEQMGCVVLGNADRCLHTHLFAPDERAQDGIPPKPFLTPHDLQDPQQLASLIFPGETNYAPLFAYFKQQKQSPPFPWACFSLANASVPKAALERVGGFDTGLAWGLEATDLAYRLHQAGVPFRFAPKAITLRQLQPDKSGNPRDLAQNLTRFFCKHPHLNPMEQEILRRGRYAPTA